MHKIVKMRRMTNMDWGERLFSSWYCHLLRTSERFCLSSRLCKNRKIAQSNCNNEELSTKTISIIVSLMRFIDVLNHCAGKPTTGLK